MKIKIVHLFYDLLNLYGESGNLLALTKAFESQDIETEVFNISLQDDLDLEDIDIIYIGTGTFDNQMLALHYLKKNFEKINEAFLNNKFFIATGNSIELFGKTITTEEKIIPGLNLFDYETKIGKDRLVAECVFNFENCKEHILGFENHQGEIFNISNPLFTVVKGFGMNKNSKCEGFLYNNFYGTYLIGPLLVRNPNFLEYLCKKIILQKDQNFTFKDFNLELEILAYQKYIKKYQDNY